MDLVKLLKTVVDSGASDLYFVVGSPPLARKGGAVAPVQGVNALRAEDVRAIVYSVLKDDQKKEFEEHHEMDTAFSVPNVARFRMNVFKRIGGMGACLRVIPTQIPTPEQIGLSEAITNLADVPRGLVLVTGPTGSGKTTTLAAILNIINQKYAKTIVTIEDPVEFVYPRAKSLLIQRNVGTETDSFNAALKHALRQAPDVILVGEMREPSTIRLALTAAETGHLCFATLHTSDATSTVDRIIGVFPAEEQNQIRLEISSALKAVVAQILLRSADGKGRVAARELLLQTTAIMNHIREGKVHMIPSEIETGTKYGMCTMEQALFELVKDGKVDREEALAKAYNPGNLQSMLASMAIGA